MPHRVGDEIELTIEKRYIEPTPAGAPGKVFYAPESDILSLGYDYFIFDAAAYIEMFGGPTCGGTAKVRIDDVALSVPWHSNPYPTGAYAFNYYHVTLV